MNVLSIVEKITIILRVAETKWLPYFAVIRIGVRVEYISHEDPETLALGVVNRKCLEMSRAVGWEACDRLGLNGKAIAEEGVIRDSDARSTRVLSLSTSWDPSAEVVGFLSISIGAHRFDFNDFKEEWRFLGLLLNLSDWKLAVYVTYRCRAACTSW